MKRPPNLVGQLGQRLKFSSNHHFSVGYQKRMCFSSISNSPNPKKFLNKRISTAWSKNSLITRLHTRFSCLQEETLSRLLLLPLSKLASQFNFPRIGSQRKPIFSRGASHGDWNKKIGGYNPYQVELWDPYL